MSSAGYFIFRIAAAVFLMSFLYLLVVYFGKNIRNIGAMKPDDQFYFANVLTYVSRICFWSGCVSAVASAMAFFLDYAYGRAIFVLGAAFSYGLPWLLWYYTPAGDAQRIVYYLAGDATPHYYLTDFNGMCIRLGYVFLVMGVVFLLRELVLEIRDAWEKSRVTSKRVKTKKRSEMAFCVHCWDTSFCSPEVKKVCPAFAASKSCWKIGKGCCDESLVLVSAAGTKNKYSERLAELMNPHTKEAMKPRNCKTCHIFMAHQKYKYRAFLPLVVLVALGIGYLVYQPLFDRFEKAVLSADRFASFLVTNNQLMLDNEAKLQGFVIFAVVVAVFALAAAGVSLLNWIIFKLKW